MKTASESPQIRGPALWLTLIVTNAVKLTGIAIAIHEAFTKSNPSATILALAAFMMAGAQISEDAILRMISHMFGGAGESPPQTPQSKGPP